MSIQRTRKIKRKKWMKEIRHNTPICYLWMVNKHPKGGRLRK